jgi:hypothetical protein
MMKKMSMIALPIALVAAGVLVGTLTFANLGSAQAQAIPQEGGLMEFASGHWLVGSFEALSFEKGRWHQIGQEGGCVIYRSNPSRENAAHVGIKTSSIETELIYPNQGVRVRVCPGFTVHFPPTTEGNVPLRSVDN